MKKDALEFLKGMTAVPSPSGFEQPVQKIVRKRMGEIADSVKTDYHGNVIGLVKAPKSGSSTKRVMLAGHCDEIGFIITYIDDNGFISIDTIGGHDITVVVGQRVEIHAEKGIVRGVIGKKAIHLMEPEDRKKVPAIKDLWIDIGAKDKKEAEKFVAVGDPVTYPANFLELKNNIVASRGFDDKVGAFVAAEVLREVAANKKKLKVDVYGVSTVQEEVGIRGAKTSAFGVDPHVGIAVDVGFVSDHPDVDKRMIGDVRMNKGPILHRGSNINPVLDRLMVKVAKANKIPYQMVGEPRGTGTDANALQLNRAGVAASLVSVPNRYMHSPNELVSLTDLDNCVKLIAETIYAIDDKTDFTP